MSTVENAREIQLRFYSRIYNNGAKSDSPDQSRVSLLRRARPHLSVMGIGTRMLDLGAGRQIFEREYFSTFGKPNCQIVTVDLADIQRAKLLKGRSKRVNHVRADGTNLPFRDESFDVAVSNMALDFMHSDAIGELYRVIKAGSYVIINLHHPALLPGNLDELLQRKTNSPTKQEVLIYWDFLRKNNILSSDPDKIETRFRSYGFKITYGVKEAGHGENKWWEVDIYKPD